MADTNTLIWFFFKFSGRVGRAAYFLGGLLVLVVQMFFFYRVTLAPEGTPQSEAWALAFLVAALVATWVNFALTAKRFHDIGRPTLFAMISLVAGFILIIILSLIRSEPGPNRYGPRADVPQ